MYQKQCCVCFGFVNKNFFHLRYHGLNDDKTLLSLTLQNSEIRHGAQKTIIQDRRFTKSSINRRPMTSELTTLCWEHLLASTLEGEQVSLVVAVDSALMAGRCSSNLRKNKTR